MQYNLLIIRKKYNMTQEQMAQIIGVSENTYARKERGENAFDGDEMFAISEFFGQSLDQIFLPRESVLNRQTKEEVKCNN